MFLTYVGKVVHITPTPVVHGRQIQDLVSPKPFARLRISLVGIRKNIM
jgi:hypothetical protein